MIIAGLPPGEEIVRRRVGAVEWIVFNRPKSRNAITHAMESQLTTIFKQLNGESAVRAVVLTGASGSKPAFMAGADMGDLQDASDTESAMRMEETSEAMLTALEEVRAPVIAAMAGACVGVGALIASACDVRLAAASLKFGFPIARTVGNALSLKNYARLVAVLGLARTKDLVFDPALLDGMQAVAAGLEGADGSMIPSSLGIGE